MKKQSLPISILFHLILIVTIILVLFPVYFIILFAVTIWQVRMTRLLSEGARS